MMQIISTLVASSLPPFGDRLGDAYSPSRHVLLFSFNPLHLEALFAYVGQL